MVDLAKDQAVLNFDKVDDALTKISQVAVYKGQQLSPKTQGIRQEIGEVIRDWKSLDPAEFHTAEGLDALKRKIGDIQMRRTGTPERLVATMPIMPCATQLSLKLLHTPACPAMRRLPVSSKRYELFR
jgi:hypothetical protein